MTLEYLAEQKEKYQKKAEYFSSISFDNLAKDFQGVVDLIDKMEEYMKEENDGEDNEN
jgi:hypothetical protein